MKIVVAAIQMSSETLDVAANLRRADEAIRSARDRGAELAVLPELFNTGYSLCPDFGPVSETADGPTITHLRRRCLLWKMAIAGGFVEREGRHLYDSLVFITPDGEVAIYRKRNLVFWERFRFHPGRAPLVVNTPWGRVGMAICADMIYRKVWEDYRDRIDLAVVSAAWPNFAPGVGASALAAGARRAALGVDPGEGGGRPGHPGRVRQPVRRDGDDDPTPGRPHRRPLRRSQQHLRRPPRRAGPGRRPAGTPRGPHHPPPSERPPVMAYYVPLGPRGLLLRIGTILIGVLGGVVYRAASRRRALAAPIPQPLIVPLPD